jgi:DNA-binding GntR family transcriptional regulator
MARLTRPETLTAAVATHIRDAIIRGDYLPGSALPEIRLAQELGTSRGTVREALRTLDELGLVDIEPHRGSFVSRVTRRKARELYELRQVLEGAAVRLAVEAGRLGPTSRDALDRRLDAMREAARADDPIAIIEAERALHREIWGRCENETLLEHLANVQVQTRRLLLYNKAFRADPLSEIRAHGELIEDVTSGDPGRAEAAIQRHVRASGDLVLARIPDDDGVDPVSAPADAARPDDRA